MGVEIRAFVSLGQGRGSRSLVRSPQRRADTAHEISAGDGRRPEGEFKSPPHHNLPPLTHHYGHGHFTVHEIQVEVGTRSFRMLLDKVQRRPERDAQISFYGSDSVMIGGGFFYQRRCVMGVNARIGVSEPARWDYVGRIDEHALDPQRPAPY